jgi:hypothetical protein
MHCILSRELKSSTIQMSAAGSSNVGSNSSFKDYEKKTNDVWDIEDDIDNQDFNSFPISITVSH